MSHEGHSSAGYEVRGFLAFLPAFAQLHLKDTYLPRTKASNMQIRNPGEAPESTT